MRWPWRKPKPDDTPQQVAIVGNQRAVRVGVLMGTAECVLVEQTRGVEYCERLVHGRCQLQASEAGVFQVVIVEDTWWPKKLWQERGLQTIAMNAGDSLTIDISQWAGL